MTGLPPKPAQPRFLRCDRVCERRTARNSDECLLSPSYNACKAAGPRPKQRKKGAQGVRDGISSKLARDHAADYVALDTYSTWIR